MVIVPAELIVDNGKKLESIVLELAHLNGLEDGFIQWLEGNNYFCNSLVDRIIPGRPDKSLQAKLEEELGYEDNLLIMSEVYRLWAIEGGEEVKKVLSFSQADEGVKIATDIELFRELKLRVLNGTHTLSCGLAHLSGSDTVVNAMEDEKLSVFIADLMQQEIALSIPYPVDPRQAEDFSLSVLDRFRNPHIQHQWLAITTQYTFKMKSRVIPVLLKYYEQFDQAPELISLGFAAYLYFMKVVREADGKYYGELKGKEYIINDDMAGSFMNRWKVDNTTMVQEVLGDSALWGSDLCVLPGFSDAVLERLKMLVDKGAKETLQFVQSKKVFA
jgi:tagaturonate reductase